jgi:hypothetical protein
MHPSPNSKGSTALLASHFMHVIKCPLICDNGKSRFHVSSVGRGRRRREILFDCTWKVLRPRTACYLSPTFLRQYDEFWKAPHEAPSSFLVILLLVMVVVQCVNPQGEPAFLGCSSGECEVSKWIAVCDSWLQAQRYKHVTLVNLDGYLASNYVFRLYHVPAVTSAIWIEALHVVAWSWDRVRAWRLAPHLVVCP